MKGIGLIAALLTACILSGCEVGPNYQRPKTAVPQAFGNYAKPATRPAATTRPVLAIDWWKTFGDPELDSLIERALQSNLDLKLAEARLREARAREAFANGGFYPTLNANAGYSHQRMSTNAQPFASVAGSQFKFPFEYDLYQAGFDASWEIDVFGGQRRSIEAATADVAASIQDARGVMLSMTAEVARNYVELRGLQAELDVARHNLAAQKQTVDVTQNLRKQGVGTELDVSRAVAQAATTESQIPLLENLRWQAIHRLALLLGLDPNALATELSTEHQIPVPENQIALGMPAELLRRRPDICQAERQLAAAYARVGVAQAELYPKLSLVGSLGLQSSEASSLGDWSSRYFNVGPSITWPIFDFGRLKAMVHVRSAEQQQALVQYQQTVLNALREVEDAIVALQTERQRNKSLTESEKANAQSAQLAEDLYRRGLTDFLTVLDAQRRLYESQEALTQSRQTVTTDAIALYKALGGGWNH